VPKGIGVLYVMKAEEKVNILIVDDRSENLLTLEAIIDNEEYRLMKAHSGEEALKLLLKHDFAVILLDVQMPGMDGFTTAKFIKAREKTKNIPILFITANNLDSQHIFMGYSVGAIDYILKPFDPIVLKAKVEGFVEMYNLKNKLIRQTEELSKRNKMIEYMAYHDGLTDLPNRRMFNEQVPKLLNQSKNKNQTLGIMYIDLDRFKYVNDSLGHIVGDKLLQKVSKRLASSIREGDFVARLGGDEYTIILPDTDRENALEVAETILESFKQAFHIDQYELFITTSIGLSIFPYDGEDSMTLLKNADTALYRAKEQGKNKYKVYHSGMNMYSYRSFLMQNDLRKAIDKEELVLVYQPRVHIDSRNVTSAEALLRWNHPSWGIISPEEFIPLAEENGQIFEIGIWVLRKVCEQIRIWKDKGISPVRIAVNFSAQQFLQKNLIDKIKLILSETNVNPELIEVEITEHVILGNETITIQALEQLKNLGVRISLDDFGTGYSSLDNLRQFPFDTIKIDKSFTQDMLTNQYKSKAIVETMGTLAKHLNMSVIAEGVETEEQLAILGNLYCQEYQGYLFSIPVLPDEFERFLRKNNDNNRLESVRLNTIQVEQPPSKGLKQDIIRTALKHIQKRYSISSREMDVFHLIITGLSNKDISEKLFISEHTVKNHITHILQKLNVTDRVQAIALVYENCINEG
jgi:diguanylate cyclase (GGDEF)-like protein